MNSAHLHIILVHIPVVLVPCALVMLAIALRRNNLTLTYTALGIFLVAAAVTVAAFLLGEGAEDVLKQVGPSFKEAIHAHEDSADFALWLTASLGIVSIANLAALKLGRALPRRFAEFTLLLSVIAAIALAYTAQKGGQIRHPEAFGAAILDAHGDAGMH